MNRHSVDMCPSHRLTSALRSRGAVAVGFLAIVAGCAGGLRPPPGPMGAPAAATAVERFLHLATEGDYLGMGWIFGTADGPSLERYPAAEVERRMYALASLVRSDVFVVGNGTPQPRAVGEATKFNVLLTQRGQTLEVPVTAVSDGDGHWFVENVAIEAITDR